MGTTPRHIQHELREAIKLAIKKWIFEPGEIEDYLLDNNWKYDLPTRQTIINILAENDVKYVSGYWSKVEKE